MTGWELLPLAEMERFQQAGETSPVSEGEDLFERLDKLRSRHRQSVRVGHIILPLLCCQKRLSRHCGYTECEIRLKLPGVLRNRRKKSIGARDERGFVSGLVRDPSPQFHHKIDRKST